MDWSYRNCVRIENNTSCSCMKRWKINTIVLILILPVLTAAQTANPADAIALEQQGKLAEAAQVWRAVTLHNPRDAAAFASLGVVLSKEEKYVEAAVAYRKALALNPRLPVQLNLGLAEFKWGRFKEAITPFNKVLADDANNLQARTLLGLSYYGTKNFAEAVKQLEIASSAQPDNSELHHVLAQSCLWAKQYDC